MFIQCILFIIKNLLFYNKFDIYNSVSENETQKSETHRVFKNRTQVISYTVEVWQIECEPDFTWFQMKNASSGVKFSHCLECW